MLFNSIDFAVFLPIVFVLYWFVTNKTLKLQNGLVAVASFIFYGWWDWRFLTLLAFSALVDFFVALQLQKEKRRRQRQYWLSLSIFLNLGLLGFFKYFNFFLDNFEQAFTFFGEPFHGEALHIILPVGISFYTFQSLSYGIDVYRRKMEPTKDVVAFLAFVSFFPQLVAGPIERAAHLLPQFFKPRVFDYTNAVIGMRLILWGFFKKIVIADNCALYVNDVFANYAHYSGSMLIFGAVLFAFQIYGDFSGYSDIAVGLARLFGFDLMRNFRYPYFAKNIADFWQRWHISLTNWFRDYLYIPLGGNRGSLLSTIRNVFIVFLVSGFWHGANWTFVMWGLVHALLFLPLLLSGKNKVAPEPEKPGFFPSVIDALRILFTFCCVTFAWIFFRAESVTQALDFLRSIATNPDFFAVNMAATYSHSVRPLLLYIGILMMSEWMSRNKLHIVNDCLESSKMRYVFYFFVLLCIILNVRNEASDFIYFQF